MQRDVLIALRARVVETKGADRRLDDAIHDCLLCDDPFAPHYTASADAVIALIERDPAYKADPVRFLTECSIHTPAKDFDYTKPIAPQSARYMLAGYLGAKIALLAQETAHG